MRGPSWNYNKLVHCYGKNESDTGIVRDHHPLQEQQCITVAWQDKRSFMYKWDDEGMFDIQLFH